MVRHTGEDFINVEGVAITSVLPLQTGGINSSELGAPETDRFSGYSDASLSQEFVDITVAEIESVVGPDSVADEIWWESIALVSIHAPILLNPGS